MSDNDDFSMNERHTGEKKEHLNELGLLGKYIRVRRTSPLFSTVSYWSLSIDGAFVQTLCLWIRRMEEKEVNGRCGSLVERSFSLCMCRLGLCLTW